MGRTQKLLLAALAAFYCSSSAAETPDQIKAACRATYADMGGGQYCPPGNFESGVSGGFCMPGLPVCSPGGPYTLCRAATVPNATVEADCTFQALVNVETMTALKGMLTVQGNTQKNLAQEIDGLKAELQKANDRIQKLENKSP
jgi:hypothetical protein